MKTPATIIYPETFRQSPPAGFDGVFDWSWTQGYLGAGKITPMDIDGCVERKGNILMFETKAVGKAIPDGQRYTLETFYKLGVVTVVLIEGKAQPERAQVWCQPGFKNGKRMKEHVAVTPDRLGAFVGEWFKFAESHPQHKDTMFGLVKNDVMNVLLRAADDICSGLDKKLRS